jgi:hypothetical protein
VGFAPADPLRAHSLGSDTPLRRKAHFAPLVLSMTNASILCGILRFACARWHGYVAADLNFKQCVSVLLVQSRTVKFDKF